METKRQLPAVLGWVLLVLGVLFSIPWLPGALLSALLGRPLSIPLMALIGLILPLVPGLPLLRRARTGLAAHAPRLSSLFLVLGGLWAVAGPLTALNVRYPHLFLETGSGEPLALLVAGAIPAFLGLAYFSAAVAAAPANRVRLRSIGGWIYFGVAVVEMAIGLVVLTNGEPFALISWLAQGSLLIVMSASLFERRTQTMGAFLVALALVLALILVPGAQAGEVSIFVLNPPGGMQAWSIPNAVFASSPVLALLVALAAALGAWQAMREVRLLRLGTGGLLVAAVLGFFLLLAVYYGLSSGLLLLAVMALTLGLAALQILRSKETSGVIGALLFLFILAFLIWASRSKEFNFTGMLISTLEAATPIALGALSGVWCERSAVINIGIEGMMLSAAFTSVVISSATKSLVLGLVVGMLTGALMAALLAVLAIRFKVNQIIAGTAINIFATGATSFLSARLLAERQDLNSSANFPRIAIPVLSRIPVIGPVFFQNNFVIYLMLILVIVTHIILFRTRWGLRSRSVGEHPQAADTLGINVIRTRYINVIIGGLIAGLGGVYFTLGSVGRFDEVMTAGRGFIGLAAMIFGRWTPIGAFGASLIFGFASSLQIKLGILEVPIPSHFLLMAPYLATMIVLAGVIGRAVAPAADGEAYEKQ
jgi:simple sugar transport system permease protein